MFEKCDSSFRPPPPPSPPLLFKIAFRLRYWHVFIPFKKLNYAFLVETTKIENATFPHKTALLEANAKNGECKMDLS